MTRRGRSPRPAPSASAQSPHGATRGRDARAGVRDRATGESHCLADYASIDAGDRTPMVASLGYHATFVKLDGA
jgi:hypothetical protein